ncbi:hypothetical protein LINPERPRIM_LOCUS20572, partial [Linum perenne]
SISIIENYFVYSNYLVLHKIQHYCKIIQLQTWVLVHRPLLQNGCNKLKGRSYWDVKATTDSWHGLNSLR